MSWLIDSDGLDHRTRRMTVHYGAEPATFSDVLGAWARDDAFVQRWCSALGGVPFAAYNWELPALVPDRLELPFECVCVDNPALARVRAEPDAFAEHFGGQSVATFRNLGGDSVLIAPAPEGDFPHLAAFCRTASLGLQRSLWSAVARTMRVSLGDAPVWLSTAGLGVYWLHLRVDPRPKYYRHSPYRLL